jgi:hypothetical protein
MEAHIDRVCAITGRFQNAHGNGNIEPPVAPITGRKVAGLDGRTTGRLGSTNQRIRKRVEEIFGWAKKTGGFRKSKHRGTHNALD